jgi:hypothetical protein
VFYSEVKAKTLEEIFDKIGIVPKKCVNKKIG